MKLSNLKKLGIIFTALGLSSISNSLPIVAQVPEIRYEPQPVDDNGEAGGTSSGAGTGSGLCEFDNPNMEINPLIALVPEVDSTTPDQKFVWGKTTQPNPTFFFYVAYPATAYAELVINDKEGNQVYSSGLFSLKATPGLVSVALPNLEGEILEVGQAYQWYFKIKCDPNRSTDDFVNGWVERVPELDEQELAGKEPLERVIIYAQNDIWFNALTELEALNNSEAWTDLLQQVDLGEVSDKPVVQRYMPPQR